MGFIAENTPTLDVARFEDIPFDVITDPDGLGIELVMTDIEATVLVRGTAEVSDAVMERREQIRANGAMLALVTNKTDGDYAALIAEIMDAEDFRYPLTSDDRKGNPDMLEDLMREHDKSPEKSMMVGDKHTSDVVAGNRAGVAVTARVERLGGPETDHRGDLIFRRPFEGGIVRPAMHIVRALQATQK